MKNLSIMSYNYNVRCDTNRCSNPAVVSIGVKGESTGTFHNICNECLEAIAHNVPIHMVLEREDVQAKIAEQVQEAIFSTQDGGTLTINEPRTVLEEVKAMEWPELRNLARDLEIEGYGQMKREIMEGLVADLLEKAMKQEAGEE